MVGIANLELLQIAEAVAREKSIPRDVVISSMELALSTAARKKYGTENNIKAEISTKTGEVKIYRLFEIVENAEDLFTQISLDDAQRQNPDYKIGDFVSEELPPIDLGRVAAQSAKQVIIQKVKEAEREKQYVDFKDRVGEILRGIVKRIEFGNIYVDIGRTEAIIKRDQLIPNETFKINDRIKAYVQDVRRDPKGPQIFLSRTDGMFLAKLMDIEIPEVYEGQIEIKAIARDPGSKAKVAVFASDVAVDAVGSCIGMRGSRIKAVSNELAGEKIDVVLWSKDLAQYIANAMQPAEISKIVLNEDRKSVEIIVPSEQLSLAIGRRGQNVRLASQLVGWHIEVMNEDEESKRRAEEFNNSTEDLMRDLNIEEVLAQLLVAEGFQTADHLAYIDLSALTNISGLDEELATSLKERAENFVNAKNEKLLVKLEALGVEQEILDTIALPLDQLIILAENGIKTLEDLGEISVKEFREILPNLEVSDEDIKNLLDEVKSNLSGSK